MAQTITVLGIDIAKLVFHIVGMDDRGHLGPAGAFEQKVTVLNSGRFLIRTMGREGKECRARFWLV